MFKLGSTASLDLLKVNLSLVLKSEQSEFQCITLRCNQASNICCVGSGMKYNSTVLLVNCHDVTGRIFDR